MIPGGAVRIAYPEANFDWISPEDIGRVSDTLLLGTTLPVDGKNAIHLYGPEEMPQSEVLNVIWKVLGKELTLRELYENEGVEQFMSSAGLPEPAARHYVGILRGKSKLKDGLYNEDFIRNIEKYSGRKPTRFEEWVLG
jgi:hypothetical protein